MELEFEDGSKIPIPSNSKTQIGRELGLGFIPKSTDRTISRRHLSLHLIEDPTEKFRVRFEVVGKNPIWVCNTSDGKCRIYKNSEKGELRAGDKFSLSLKSPSFFVVKRREGENEEGEEERRVLDAAERREKEERLKEEFFEGEEDEEIGCIDVSHIDPVKEFGFLVKGHEFDPYLRKMITDVRSWNWFVEEASDDTDDETMDGSGSSKGRRKGRRTKKKKGRDNEDEDWTGESEEDKVAVIKEGSTKRPKYSTRSKVPKRPRNDASGTSKKDAKALEDEVEQADDEDETLGGFIVDEEEEAEEEDDEESEEEFEMDEEENE